MAGHALSLDAVPDALAVIGVTWTNNAPAGLIETACPISEVVRVSVLGSQSLARSDPSEGAELWVPGMQAACQFGV